MEVNKYFVDNNNNCFYETNRIVIRIIFILPMCLAQEGTFCERLFYKFFILNYYFYAI